MGIMNLLAALKWNRLLNYNLVRYPFGALAGLATRNVEISPYMRSMSIFELSKNVPTRIEPLLGRKNLTEI
jgi:hypothetical protein